MKCTLNLKYLPGLEAQTRNFWLRMIWNGEKAGTGHRIAVHEPDGLIPRSSPSEKLKTKISVLK